MIGLLAKFELLQDLGDDGRQVIADYLEERALRVGETVFSAGDEAAELLFVVDGELKLEIPGETLGALRPGEVLGAASLVLIGNRECSASAGDPSVLLVLTRESYLRLRSDAPTVALALMEGILRTIATDVREVLTP